MTRRTLAAVAAAVLAAPLPAADFPAFKVQEIASDLTIGYAVIVEDLNGDKKPDIVVVDKHRVVWYENPTWKPRTLLQGKTKPDNVCITALDITGDGLPELVIGAGWKPFDTQNPGTLQWLERGKSVDNEWTMHAIPCDEPTVHRVRALDIDGDGKPEVVHVPLMGRDATAKGNWTDGRPVRVIAYKVPADPRTPSNWKPEVLSDSLHVCHNFAPFPGGSAPRFLVTSYDGVHVVGRHGDKWATGKIGEGNQANPKSNRGASEIKAGKLTPAGGRYIATVEPWHGNQIVAYTEPTGSNQLWTRTVLDDQLRWGHAVTCADLDGDGADELVIGVRDDPNPKAGDTFTERRGVRLYKPADALATKWDRIILENGGVAVEDLAVADLNADGKQDIVAVGRATGNARVYWNQGK